MNLLYISDNGFSQYKGKFFYSYPNHSATITFQKYFDHITYMARVGTYNENHIEISPDSNVVLIGKKSFVKFIRTMRELKDDYDIIYAQNGFNSIIAALYGKWLNKTIFSYCGSDPLQAQFGKRTLKGYIKGALWYLLERRKMTIANYAEYCTEVLTKRYPCRCPYIICSNVYVNIDETVLERRLQKINAPHQKYVIGLMGQLNNANKGLDTALAALRELGKKYSLQVVGEGNAEPWIELAGKLDVLNQVEFLGYISNRDVLNNWLENIDIYIQPSLSEGLPRSTIEAMAQACPVVASNISGIPTLIEQKYLIKRKNHIELAQKIGILSFDTVQACQQATKNFERAKDFRVEIRDMKMHQFLSKVIAQKY